jgi:uncharacterized protein YndB with AHSA1/START domain
VTGGSHGLASHDAADVVVVSRSIYIDAPVQRVFALVADPLARSRLNPAATPIRVEVEGDGPLRAGSRVHFRLKVGEQIADYHAEVRELIANRRIVTLAQAHVPFEVVLETEPHDRGTLLTQTESFEPTEEMLEAEWPQPGLRALLPVLRPVLVLLSPDYAARLRCEQEALLAQRLGERLERWLAAIRDALESPPHPG